MALPLLVRAAVMSGLVLCLVLTLIMALSSRVAVDMWLDNYPADVRKKYGPMGQRGRRLRPYVAAGFILAMLAVPLVGLFVFAPASADLTFGRALVFGFLALLTFNVYDLLVLDFLVFSTWQPRWIVLPGTEGMAGYRDYGFHVSGFFRGLAFSLVGGLVIAACAMALKVSTPG